jgi:hypothetical protein
VEPGRRLPIIASGAAPLPCDEPVGFASLATAVFDVTEPEGHAFQ